MRTITVLLVGLVLILAGAASAKNEITRLRVCGPARCKVVTDPSARHAFINAITNAAQGRSAPVGGAYFTIRAERTKEWPVTWPRYVYVPRARMIRLQIDRRDRPEWRWLGRRDAVLRKITSGLTPYRANR
jgi:hypothetical protein